MRSLRQMAGVLLALLLAAPVAAQNDPKSGFLGIGTIDDPRGARISAILLDTPADKAGLLKDDVVSKIDGAEIQDRGELSDILHGHPPGTKIKLEVWRAGARQEVTVTLTSIEQTGPLLVQRHPPRAYGGEFENGKTTDGNLDLQIGTHIIQDQPVVDGDYTHGRGALMICRLEGPQQHSSLRVTGRVQLDGTLCVQLGEYEPGAGKSFELIRDAKALHGKFRHLLLPLLPPELRWEVVYDDIANKLDYDNDGKHDVTLLIRPLKPGKK